MAANKDQDAEFEVGYGKPPRHTQFQPGQSGNSRGRPKGRSSFQAIFEKRLYQNTKIKVGGDIQNVTIIDAIAMRLVQVLLQGPSEKAIPILKFALPMLSNEPLSAEQWDLTKLDDDELEEFEKLVGKVTNCE